jgi:hypothetical protein
VKRLRTHEQNVKQAFSNLEKINLAWLRKLSIWMGFIWAIHTIFWTLLTFGIRINPYGMNGYLFGFSMSIVVYAVGYMGLTKPEIFSGVLSAADAARKIKKYERSGLSDDRAEDYLQRLVSFVETERPYRRGNLEFARTRRTNRGPGESPLTDHQ